MISNSLTKYLAEDNDKNCLKKFELEIIKRFIYLLLLLY